MSKYLKFSLIILFLNFIFSCSNDDDCTCAGRFELPSGNVEIVESVNCETGEYVPDKNACIGVEPPDICVIGTPIAAVNGTFIGCE